MVRPTFRSFFGIANAKSSKFKGIFNHHFGTDLALSWFRRFFLTI